MKKLILFLFIGFSVNGFSQGCNTPLPFCTGTTYALPLTVNGPSAQAGVAYGCLATQPNPTFFYFQISTPGNLVFNVAGTAGGDVDAICWGPFTSPNYFCNNPQSANSGSIVDCSYSTSATETISVPSGLVGQFYILMVTNYSNMPQNLVLSQTGGNGQTNCNVTNCNIANTASICFVNTNNIPNNEVYFNHTSSNFQGTIIYRQNAANTWDSIGYVPSTQPDEFTDLTAIPNQQDYTYSTAQVDSCGNLHSKSPSHTTILLQSSLGTSGQVNLSWNAYLGINVPSYHIYRGSSPTNMSLIGQVSSTTYAYTDLTPLPGTNYYKVAVTAPANCTSNATHDTLIGSNYKTANVISTSVNHFSNPNGFNIYPNPTKNGVTISSAETLKSIEITDVLGNSILSIIPSNNIEVINLQSFNKGIYFVRSTNSKGIFCQKLLIE